MQCQTCNTTLVPGASTCSICGTSVASGNTAAPSYTPIGGDTPYFEYAPLNTVATPAPPAIGSPPQAYPDGYAMYGNQPYPLPPPPYGMPLPPMPILPPKKKRISTWAIVLTSIVVAVVLLGSCSILFYTTLYPAMLSSARFQTQGGDPQNIYAKATTGTPALTDPLDAKAHSLWLEDTGTNRDYGCKFTDGAYHVTTAETNQYFNCSNILAYSNFAFQVRMNITKGDSGGIIFRGNIPLAEFYMLRINPDGSYEIFLAKGDTAKATSLKYGQLSSSLFTTGLNAPNLITVIAQGNTLYLYVNQQFVTRIIDSTYTTGFFDVGLFAEDDSNPTDVAYTQEQVWKL